MKNLLFIFSFCLLAGTLSAQINLGAKGGASFSTTYGSAEEFDGEAIETVELGVGFQAGAFVELGITEKFSLLGELNYELKKGVKNTEVTVGPATLNAKSENSFSFVNIPVLAVFGGEGLRFYAGPNFAFMLDGTGDFTSTVTTPLGKLEDSKELDFIDGATENTGPLFETFDLGVNAGVMFNVSEKLFVDLRLNTSVVDVTINDSDESTVAGLAGARQTRDDNDSFLSIQLSAGYRF